MAIEVGAVYFDLLIKNTIGKQMDAMAQKASVQAKSAFAGMGSAAGKTMENAVNKSFSRSLEMAKAKLSRINDAWSEMEAKVSAIESTKMADLSEFYKKPADLNAAVEKTLSGDKAYQKAVANAEAAYQKMLDAKARVTIEMDALSYKQAAAQEKAQQRIAAATERAQEKARAASQRAAERMQQAHNRAAASTRKSWSSSAGVMQRLFRSVGSAIKSTFLMAGLYSFFKAFKSMISSAGSQNQAFAQSLAQVKGNLATAFAPILSAVMPMLNALMSGLAAVTRSIASFMAALFGTTYAKAAAAAKKLGSVGAGAAKKAKNATLGIDELNIIEKDDGGSGGASGGAAYDPGAVDSTAASIGEAFRAALAKYLEPLKQISFENLTSAFERLKTALSELGKDAFAGLEWAYFNILVPLAQWTIEDAAPRFFDLLAAALDVLKSITEAAKEPLAGFGTIF